MKPNAEYRLLLRAGLLLILVMALILWMSRPTMSQLPPARQLTARQLDPARQVVSVRLDSLATLLRAIPTEVATWADEGDALAVSVGEPKLFQEALLNGSDLSVYEGITASPLHVIKNRTGFSVPIRKRGEVRFVTLPADVLHSLQLYLNNQ